MLKFQSDFRVVHSFLRIGGSEDLLYQIVKYWIIQRKLRNFWLCLLEIADI